MFIPPRGAKLHFEIESLIGWDSLLPALPMKLQLRILARKLLRRNGWPETVEPGMFSFGYRGQCWEIISPSGAVRPFVFPA